jgi:hypothetical protein
MLATIDPDMGGPLTPRRYKCISTENGITYNVYDSVFTISNQSILDPENFRLNDSTWYIYSGGVPGMNLLGKSTNDGNYFQSLGEICTDTSQSPPDCFVCADITEYSPAYYIMHAFGDAGKGYEEIAMLSSTDCLTWMLEGTALSLSASSTVESQKVWAPTVIKLNNGTYLMVYETILHSAWSQTLDSIAANFGDTTLFVGDTLWFSAMGYYSDMSKRDLTTFAAWNSSNTAVGSIDSRGMFVAGSVGITNVKASENSIESDIAVITVQSQSGIKETCMFPLIQLYPNPTNGILNIVTAGSEDAAIAISNTFGQTIMECQTHFEKRITQIDMTAIPSGLYFFQSKNMIKPHMIMLNK